MNKRIQIIRHSTKLNQANFGATLGVTKDTLGKIERGDQKPTETFKMLLCMKYNINPTWLETGEGNMHTKELGKTPDLNAKLTKMVETMSEANKRQLIDFLEDMINHIK